MYLALISPEAAAPTEDVVELVEAYIQTQRPVGAKPVISAAEALEVTINGERHLLTKSSLIFAPAGLPHMRISIKRVDRPMFHFSVVMNPEYKGGAYEK